MALERASGPRSRRHPPLQLPPAAHGECLDADWLHEVIREPCFLRPVAFRRDPSFEQRGERLRIALRALPISLSQRHPRTKLDACSRRVRTRGLKVDARPERTPMAAVARACGNRAHIQDCPVLPSPHIPEPDDLPLSSALRSSGIKPRDMRRSSSSVRTNARIANERSDA